MDIKVDLISIGTSSSFDCCKSPISPLSPESPPDPPPPELSPPEPPPPALSSPPIGFGITGVGGPCEPSSVQSIGHIEFDSP